MKGMKGGERVTIVSSKKNLRRDLNKREHDIRERDQNAKRRNEWGWPNVPARDHEADHEAGARPFDERVGVVDVASQS
jgi:hypothetical protein